MKFQYSPENKILNVDLGTRFDYLCVQPFLKECGKHLGEGITFHIDFKNTEYVDSSGLGGLLILQKFISSCDKAFSESSEGTIVLKNISGEVRDLFKQSRFDKLFEID